MGTRVGIIIAVVLIIAVVGYFGFYRQQSDTQTAVVAAAPAAAAIPLASSEPDFTIDPTKPFGDIDVTPAHSMNAKAIAAWVGALPVAQQTALNTRCNYMLGREGQYRVDDLTFCQQWQFGRSPGL